MEKAVEGVWAGTRELSEQMKRKKELKNYRIREEREGESIRVTIFSFPHSDDSVVPIVLYFPHSPACPGDPSSFLDC